VKDRSAEADAVPALAVDASIVAAALQMQPHPEGGWYSETWRASSVDGERPVGSSILYLLAAGERSHWHRVDADEIWQYSGGDPLELRVWAVGDATVTSHRLGYDVSGGEGVQAVVPAGTWQAASPLGAWSLVGCIVIPAFEFAGFELASPDWEPPIETPDRPAPDRRVPDRPGLDRHVDA
jgi:predicted cupin superfamily sugar epimerase